MPLLWPPAGTPAWYRFYEQTVAQRHVDIMRLWNLATPLPDPQAGIPFIGIIDFVSSYSSSSSSSSRSSSSRSSTSNPSGSSVSSFSSASSSSSSDSSSSSSSISSSLSSSSSSFSSSSSRSVGQCGGPCSWTWSDLFSAWFLTSPGSSGPCPPGSTDPECGGTRQKCGIDLSGLGYCDCFPPPTAGAFNGEIVATGCTHE